MINISSFSHEYALHHLLAHFNELPPENRTVSAGELLIFKVTSFVGTNGKTTFVIGEPPAEYDNDALIGIITFLWVGQRDEPVEATSSDFLEIGRFINPTKLLPPAGPVVAAPPFPEIVAVVSTGWRTDYTVKQSDLGKVLLIIDEHEGSRFSITIPANRVGWPDNGLVHIMQGYGSYEGSVRVYVEMGELLSSQDRDALRGPGSVATLQCMGGQSVHPDKYGNDWILYGELGEGSPSASAV